MFFKCKIFLSENIFQKGKIFRCLVAFQKNALKYKKKNTHLFTYLSLNII